MPEMQKKAVTCPSCSEEGLMEVWTGVNVGIEPMWKEKVGSREIFTYTCPHCQSKITVAYDFLYHDPQGNYMIYLLPGGGGRSFDSIDGLSAEKLEGYCLREVSDINGLLEKIMLFDDGLDDRCIEICKLYLSEQYAAQNKGKKLFGIYYNGKSEDGSFLEFFLFGEGGEMCGTKLPIQVYDKVFLKLCGSEFDRTDEYRIDFQWAVSAFEHGILAK